MLRASFSGISTALSALQANQKRLDIIGQNLSNMNTPGYTRQQLEASSLNYSHPVSHYTNGSEVTVGFGVYMDRVSQIRDPYLDVQYRSQMNKSSYTDSMQTALDSLARVLDESNISGIRDAFSDIQATLTDMQDLPKVDNAVYESELRARMQALTNLLNQSAKQIHDAEKAEFDRLNGAGTSEEGAEQKVNDILRQIGDLNITIKKNQIFNQPSLELMDERNLLLDELASYLPIEVTYYKDAAHSGTYTAPDGSIRDKGYEYDKHGNVIGKKEWPDDLRVTMDYTDAQGVSHTLVLVNGTEGGKDQNYGSMTVVGDRSDPTKVSVTLNSSPNMDGTTGLEATANFSASESQLKGGSIQASLDMLGKTGTGQTIPGTQTQDKVRGYEYYIKQLDLLAKTFADTMNTINNDPNIAATPGGILLEAQGGGGITAANISISQDWISGAAKIASGSSNRTDVILEMLNSMSKTYTDLGNNSYSDFMNNVSVTLASDSSSNQTSLKTDVIVLNGIHNSRDSVSGVSLDEEAANMMAFSSAYNAASRLMTAFDEALDRLINNTGLVGR